MQRCNSYLVASEVFERLKILLAKSGGRDFSIRYNNKNDTYTLLLEVVINSRSKTFTIFEGINEDGTTKFLDGLIKCFEDVESLK
jgi:hypothetical protein